MAFHDQSFLARVSCGHLCQGVGQSPNWPALAKRPWATLAGTAALGAWGEQPRAGLGTEFCVTSTWSSFALPWQPSPLPSSLSPPCFLTPHFGFPSPGVPLLPLSSALWQLPLFQLLKSHVNQTHLSANTSCSQKSSGEGDSGLSTQSAFCVQSWLRYLKNLMVFEHWLYYLFHFIF